MHRTIPQQYPGLDGGLEGSGLSPETLKTYKLGSTPQTIVISPEGKVLQDWVGAYVGDQKSQVEAFFQVTLPGLRELPKAEAAKN